jgi:hypothetical protein
VLGVLLVLGATVLGARLAVAADDRVEYWAVASSPAAGDEVSPDDLRPAKVVLPADAARRYLRTDETLDARLDDLVWAHGQTSGSLVSRDALVPAAATRHAQLPLGVAPGSAPADLSRGDRVDVWVGPAPGSGDVSTTEAVRVLQGVRVLRSGGDAIAAGGSAGRTVLVDVEASRLGSDVVSRVAAGHVTLVRVP